MEHSESEPVLAYEEGNLARSGKAQKLDIFISLDGRVYAHAGRFIWGKSVSFYGSIRQWDRFIVCYAFTTINLFTPVTFTNWRIVAFSIAFNSCNILFFCFSFYK